MQVLLLKTVTSLGKAGDVMDVKPGYATNFLIPKGLATVDLSVKVEKKNVKLDKKSVKEIISKISKKPVIFTRKSNEKGVLFSSISAEDIKNVLLQKDPQLNKDNLIVDLKTPIKDLGEFSASAIFAGTKAKIAVKVLSE